MKKSYFLILVLLLCFLPYQIFSQQSSGFRFKLSPGAIIPAGSSINHYGIGVSADFEADYHFSFAPALFALANIGFEQSKNTITNSNLSLISASAGAGIALSPVSRLSFTPFVCGGYYIGLYDNQTGGSALAKGGADISFQFSPSFSLGLSGAYHHYFTGTDAMFQGVQASLRAAFNPSGSKGRSRLELIDIDFNQIFPVFHAYYAKNPVGTVVLKNEEKGTIEDVSVSLYVKEYMANPTASNILKEIPRGQERTVPLFALFGKNILELTEGTEASAEIIVEYSLSGTDVTTREPCILQIERRNAMTWEDDNRAASFVTANDPAVLRFSKPIAAAVRESDTISLNDNFRYAFAIFQGLSEYGIGYVVDPSTPYQELSENRYSVDFLQFPNETLTYRSGDCDDLSIMYAALLQSVNINAAFVTVPGHIFIAFALDIPPEEGRKLFSDPQNLIFRDDNTWVPIEITMFKDGFLKAWIYAAKEWRLHDPDGDAGFFPISEAWKTYRPVDSPFDDTDITIPETSVVLQSYKSGLDSFIRIDIAERKEALEKKIRESNNHPRQINRLGVLYARHGLMDDALEAFEQASSSDYVPAIINIGNIHYTSKNFPEALESFTKADRLSPDSAKIILGLARTNYEMENYGSVKGEYNQIRELDPTLAEKYSYLISASTETSRAGSGKERSSLLWSEE